MAHKRLYALRFLTKCRGESNSPGTKKVITISETKRYEYKITLGKDWQGKSIRKSFYSTKSRTDAKRKAERYRTSYEVSLLCGGEAQRKQVLFKEWAVEALEKFKKPYVKGNTYNGTYLQPVQNHLIPHFGAVPLDNILPIHVQEYVNQAAKKYKPETVKKDIAVLAFLMENAVDNGLCKSNPVTKSIRLPKIERADKTAYTQEQYDIAYEFAKNYPDGLSIMLLLETGISRSELLGLTWDDFDSERGIIHIRQGLVSYKDADEGCITVSDGLKNEYRRRSIPIVEPELLKRLREKPRQITYTVGNTEISVDTTHIFHSPEGKPYQPNNWNNRVFLRYMNALVKAHPEIPKLSVHELRHTRATLWIAQGVSPMMVARLLGHSDLKMLMRIYDHTDVETLRNAITSANNK